MNTKNNTSYTKSKSLETKDTLAKMSGIMNPHQVSYAPYIKQKYLEKKETIAKALGITNPHEIPKLKSVTLHARYGKFLQDNNKKKFVFDNLSKIAGQSAVEISAKHSIAQYKLRAGMICGCKATLRGDAAYDFMTRLWFALPRSRNFTAFKVKSFDIQNNFNFGLSDHTIFAEVESELDTRFGFDVSISTHSKNQKSTQMLLEALGMPFRR